LCAGQAHFSFGFDPLEAASPRRDASPLIPEEIDDVLRLRLQKAKAETRGGADDRVSVGQRDLVDDGFDAGDILGPESDGDGAMQCGHEDLLIAKSYK
jgi:hypothetical protein